MESRKPETTILFKETDPLKYNLKDPTATQDYNLSFSGANDRANYYASLGYYKADGAFPSTFYSDPVPAGLLSGDARPGAVQLRQRRVQRHR